MDKLGSLDFSNANNACLSLRTLAEWVRVGEVTLTVSTADAPVCEPHSADIMLGFSEKGVRR